jgi:outer membrane protein assembly factor BamA
MRLWSKLLVVFLGSIFISASIAKGQNRFLINEVTIQSDQLTKPDLDQLTLPLRTRNLSPEDVRLRVLSGLKNLGYFRASADEPTVETEDPGKPSAKLSLKVREGPRYRVAEVQVAGATAFSPSRLQDLFPISAGNWYGSDSISMGLNSLPRLYCGAGYRNTSVIPQLKVDDTSHKIEVLVDVQEGDHAEVGQ